MTPEQVPIDLVAKALDSLTVRGVWLTEEDVRHALAVVLPHAKVKAGNTVTVELTKTFTLAGDAYIQPQPHAPQPPPRAGTMTTFTDEEMAEHRRSDTHKMDAAEELLGNLGYAWDDETGEWA